MEAARKAHRGNDRLLWCGVLARHPGSGDWMVARTPLLGRGLATEAARTALRDAFERARLDRIISVARPANTASIRIIEKLGLKLECEFDSTDGVRLLQYSIDGLSYFASRESVERANH